MSLTHFNKLGHAHMVDVSRKEVTARTAVASGHIKMASTTLDIIAKGHSKKGDVLAVARVAGIMASQKTSELIPLCHSLPITNVSLDFELDVTLPGVTIKGTVKTLGQTGVEMEALTIVSVAALSIYDMVKAADKTMEIGGIHLLLKDGGSSGRYEAR